jgi:hypothetical protein
MEYLIKQMAFLSEAWKVFIDKLSARVDLGTDILGVWGNIRSMLDTHLYESIAILNYCQDLNFDRPQDKPRPPAPGLDQ